MNCTHLFRGLIGPTVYRGPFSGTSGWSLFSRFLRFFSLRSFLFFFYFLFSPITLCVWKKGCSSWTFTHTYITMLLYVEFVLKNSCRERNGNEIIVCSLLDSIVEFEASFYQFAREKSDLHCAWCGGERRWDETIEQPVNECSIVNITDNWCR